MIVIAIMAIVMTMSVPIIYKVRHKAPLRKAVSDVVEVCSRARAQAILKGVMTEVTFHPREKRSWPEQRRRCNRRRQRSRAAGRQHCFRTFGIRPVRPTLGPSYY